MPKCGWWWAINLVEKVAQFARDRIEQVSQINEEKQRSLEEKPSRTL